MRNRGDRMTMTSRQPRGSLLDRWARLAHRRRGRVLAVWAAVLVAMIALQAVFAGDYDSGFDMPGTESQRAVDLLEARYPARAGSDGDIVFKAEAGIESPAVQPKVEEVLTRLGAIEGVTSTESPF